MFTRSFIALLSPSTDVGPTAGRPTPSQTMRTKVPLLTDREASAVSACAVLSATILRRFDDQRIAPFILITTWPPWGFALVPHELSVLM